MRSANRRSELPELRYNAIGFRIGFQKVPGDTPLTDSNFHDAIALWFDAEENATAIYGHISDWNTSAVTNMSYAFQDRTGFNEDISEWDTSFVINMMRMFSGATSFNQPIGDWNVSSVTNIRGIFNSATSFNQALGNWDVSSVTDMREVFMGNSAFNQPIGDWNVSSVTTMYQMFHQATSFNQPLADWNVSGVNNTRAMFKNASAFDQDISNWDTSSVTSMGLMFDEANALSNSNKGKIHQTFSTNQYWEYDWSEYAVPPLQVGLVAWYPFDGNASDMSGNGNHGTVNGATLSTDRHGQTTNAYSFDGENDFIDLNNPSILGTTNNFSIIAWVRSGTGSIYGEFNAASGNTRNYFYITSGNRLGMDQYFPTGGAVNSLELSELNQTNSWNQVGYTRAEANWSFFANGELMNLGSNSENYSGSTPDLGYIGARAYTYGGYSAGVKDFFTGSIDDIRIYDRALSTEEVSALYRLESPNHFAEMNSSVDLEMIWVEPGTFTMGQNDISDASPDET